MHMRIDGKDSTSENGRWLDVINPATGEVIDRIPDGNKGDVDAAVDAAEKSFPGWAGLTVRERGLLLCKAAELVRTHYKDLGRLLTTEQGKPVAEANDEVRGFANILEFYAGLSSFPSGETVRLGKQGDCLIIREPVGICGAVIPWNMPVLIMGWKVGPALLAGNSMVLKPSSSTPLTTLRLAALMEEAGIPPGVLNVVTGGGGPVGEAIITHPSIGKVSFTGSCETGCRVRQIAGNKDIILELGGSDPMIVMDDADIGKGVEGAIRGRFYNAGQTCTAVKRLFVHENIADSFIAQLKERAETIRVGNGLDTTTRMGPLHSRQQLERISGLVSRVKDDGEGRILTGGCTPEGEQYKRGYFYRPTLVVDVTGNSRLLTGEVFGPVLPVMVVPDLDTAISEANATQYGLGASVWTNNMAHVKQVFDEVHAGIIWVNRHLTVPPEVPFGGMKESGSGRENGYQAISSYTRTKTLFLGW